MLIFYKEISQKGLDGGSDREESREIDHNAMRTRLKTREIKKFGGGGLSPCEGEMAITLFCTPESNNK